MSLPTVSPHTFAILVALDFLEKQPDPLLRSSLAGLITVYNEQPPTQSLLQLLQILSCSDPASLQHAYEQVESLNDYCSLLNNSTVVTSDHLVQEQAAHATAHWRDR